MGYGIPPTYNLLPMTYYLSPPYALSVDCDHCGFFEVFAFAV